MMSLWRHHVKESTRRAPSAVLSVVAHVIVIVAAVDATAIPTTSGRELPENSIARFLAPPDRATAQRPQAEMIRYVIIAIPDVETGRVLDAVPEAKPLEQLARFDVRDDAPLPEVTGRDSVYSVVEVDSVAMRYEWSAAPAYPPRMLDQTTEGVVRAEFVVSQEGYVDTTTFRVTESTHPDFTRAVVDALPFMRFRPARIGANAVSQLVSQEFFFKITSVADTQPVRSPKP